MDPELLDQFHNDMLRIYERGRDELNYRAIRYLQMVRRRGGLNAAKKLINDRRPSFGMTLLQGMHRLDISVEALVWDNEKYHELFTGEELIRVKEKLESMGYLR